MTASELIEELQSAIQKYGDWHVLTYSDRCGYVAVHDPDQISAQEVLHSRRELGSRIEQVISENSGALLI